MLLDYHTNGDPTVPKKLSPVAAVVVPLLKRLLLQPVPAAQLPAAAAPPAVVRPGDSEIQTDSESESESEARSSEYYSAAPSLASS